MKDHERWLGGALKSSLAELGVDPACGSSRDDLSL